VGRDLLLDAVPFDTNGARMNVAINLPPHMMAILVNKLKPRACYTRFMRHDGMSKPRRRGCSQRSGIMLELLR
jgi:hypothetical protein